MKIIILCILYIIILPQHTTKSHVIFQYQCPQGCFCVPDIMHAELLIISCRWQTINSFETTFPKNATKSLTIQCSKNAKNKEYYEDLFIGFDKLKELRILHCKTNSLTTRTFKGISSLQSLYLLDVGSSALTLNKSFFMHFKDLEKFTLANSELIAIENRALCLLPFLQILNVSSNYLTSASMGVGASDCLLDQLIILDLSGNKIKKLTSSEFNAFPSIRQLSISSNQLEKIDSEAFKSINLIQHLDLSNNYIREISSISDSLLYINLSNNKLKTIPASVANLLSLISLNISKNLIDSTTPFSLLSSSIKTIDMSKNQFSEIPLHLIRKSADTLLALNLASNNINKIIPFSFQNFSSLKELDLSNNNIKSLSSGIYNGLNELLNLQINNNSIDHIDIEVFHSLGKKLTTLAISNNFLTELPMAVGRLNKIKTINLSGNRISKAYKFVLNKLTHLSKLDLSNNNLQEIESYVFSDSVHLSELILRNNQITTISNDAFEKCLRLKKIDLAENKLKQLGTSLIDARQLKNLNIDSNEFERLDWSKIPTELYELSAINNKIKSISKVRESNVKIINLQKNKIQTLDTEQLPPLLEEINISQNQLQQISKHSFIGKSQLRLINVQNNSLKTVPEGILDQSLAININFPGLLYLSGNPLVCNCEMSWILNVTANKIAVKVFDIKESQCFLPLSQKNATLYNVSFEDYLCRYNNTCEPGCICCQYGNCDCKSKCPDGCECYRDNNYKTNIIKCHSIAQQKIAVRELPMHASHIYLNGINLPVLRSHDFIGRVKLIQLHIISSNLQTIEPLALNTLPKLRVLNLSGNKLQRINGDESFKTQRLQKLNIENNKINEIDPRLLEIMPNLETLHAAGNLFIKLPKYLQNDLAKERLNHISLGNNPFRCDCSITNRFQTQTWVFQNQKRLIDTDNIYCVENITQSLLSNDTTVLTSFSPNFENLYKISMLQFLEQENRSLCVINSKGFFGGTNTENTIFVTLIGIFFILLLGVVLLLLLRKKKVQKYQLANSMTLSPGISPGNSPLPNNLLNQFDLFVSYSKDDQFAVVQQLCRPLEIQDYSLCLLHQSGGLDYNNGLHSINDELNQQLNTCQTLLIFITKSFLENEWKTVQIKTSHKIFAKMKNKKLIAIISDEIRTNELDEELGQILRKNTCIQRNHQLFWNLLMSALPERESLAASETSQIYSDAAYGSIVPSEIV